MSNLSVFGEIGRLQAVAIHRPGLEVDYMTPSLMHQLLFDDILFGREARVEHDEFADVLKKVVPSVVDVQDLLAESLAIPDAKSHFVDRFSALHNLEREDGDKLMELKPKELALRAVTGGYEEKDNGYDYEFRFPPVPNLLFMRDPASVIGEGVSLNNMSTSARQAEPFIMDTIFRFHPDYHVADLDNIWFDAIPKYMEGYPEGNHTIEGGDILVLSPDLLAVGISIRTTHSAVTMLAERLRRHGQFKTLLAVMMPHERAVMHLDTIFTQIDEDHCLIFPPYFRPDNPHALPTVKMDLSSKELRVVLKDNFLMALKEEGFPLKPVFCGGQNRIDQEREQWTDGANAFCLAPGIILGYDRNLKTADELNRVGYHVITSKEALEPDRDLLDGKRYFIRIKGNELSRARGGPRCMTMPLKRDPFYPS